ncbi:MAG TPA: exodeoxyribonuclease VII small subunit [Candidatus Limnocylindria bacterium]|jgi:exodeoxyribonuclease VII small subunit|nr:exodeoxyribonuclease VII small subunit [Candidatus Limnocylindria bacterium]
MSAGDSPKVSFEELLVRLEGTIAQLAEGTAPLDELVAAHQRAAGLIAEAEGRLDELKARADRLVTSLHSDSPIVNAAPARKE